MSLHRLGWGEDELGAFVAKTLAPEAGTWVFGIYGAVAEFCVGAGETSTIAWGAHLTALTDRGAMRLALSDRIRALQIGDAPDAGAIMVLAVPRDDARLPAHSVITSVGRDGQSIHPAASEEEVYDLGLGTPIARFCIRTADQTLIKAMKKVVGTAWREALPKVGRLLVEVSPTRFVVSPIGRAEVYTRIPLPTEKSEAGPHTHFLPEFLSAGRETAAGLDIPEAYAPAAIFYSRRAPAEGHA